MCAASNGEQWQGSGEITLRAARSDGADRRAVVVGQVPRQDASQADFIQDDQMLETLASNGAANAFRVRVLPRGTCRGEDLMDSHSDRRVSDPRERVITIANEIPRDLVPRK